MLAAFKVFPSLNPEIYYFKLYIYVLYVLCDVTQ